ncbi:MAG: hypothetical protein ACI4EN_05280, partial [Butyrivibrio sp.]
FTEIGRAYGIESYRVTMPEDIIYFQKEINHMKPVLVEVMLPEGTKAYPKTYFGREMYNQKPYIEEEVMQELLNL